MSDLKIRFIFYRSGIKTFINLSRIRSHRNQVVEDCLSAISPDEILRQGGAGNKVLRVIEGKIMKTYI